MPIITLTTDFGWRDSYVGAMKGVLYSLAPDAHVVDVAHDVPPHDVVHGAFVIAQAAPHFPKGSIHIGVIDPGVGSLRKALCASCDGQYFIGPDNGLFALVAHAAKQWTAYQLADTRFFRPEVSSTFHGRDIFAPVAAHLARGESPDSFGPPLERPIPLELPHFTTDERQLVGEVIYIDHFGSAVTNIRQRDVPTTSLDRVHVRVGGTTIHGLSRTYEERGRGEVLALIGSTELLEIAIRDGNAAEELDLQRGTQIFITT